MAFTDDFNRANNLSLGTNWVEHESTTDTHRILSNTLFLNSDPADQYGFAVVNASVANDQYAQAVFSSIGTAGTDNYQGVGVRQSGNQDSYTGYFVGYESTAHVLKLKKFVAQSLDSVTGTVLGSASATLAALDLLYIEVIGTAITVKLNGATVIGPITDAAITSGTPGFANNPETGSTAQQLIFDNFESTTAIVPVPPNPPSGLLVTGSTAQAVYLSWIDNSSDETGFKVERSTDGVIYTLLATIAADITAYIDSTIAASTLYYYRVIATNAVGDSAASNVVSLTTLFCIATPGNPDPSSKCLNSTGLIRPSVGSGDSVTGADFGVVLDQLEQQINVQDIIRTCSINGVATFDFACACNYELYLTENITSIILQNCGQCKTGQFDLIASPGSSFTVCGLPGSLGTDGSECVVTLNGGTNGVKYSFLADPACGSVPGSGVGAVLTSNPLRLECNPFDIGCVNCEYDSNLSGVDDHKILIFTDGLAPFPYTWQVTRGYLYFFGDVTNEPHKTIVGTLSLGSTDHVIWNPCPLDKVFLPANAAVHAFDSQFSIYFHLIDVGAPGSGLHCCTNGDMLMFMRCDGNKTTPTQTGSTLCPLPPNFPICSDGADGTACTGIDQFSNPCAGGVNCVSGNSYLTGGPAPPTSCYGSGIIADIRSPDMISGAIRCCPTKGFNGDVVTITDGLGRSVSVTISDINP